MLLLLAETVTQVGESLAGGGGAVVLWKLIEKLIDKWKIRQGTAFAPPGLASVCKRHDKKIVDQDKLLTEQKMKIEAQELTIAQLPSHRDLAQAMERLSDKVGERIDRSVSTLHRRLDEYMLQKGK